MKISAAQLAQLLNGALEGNPEAVVSRPARIEEAEDGDLTFLDNPRYEPYAYTTRASVMLVNKDFQAAHKIKPAVIRVADVRGSLAFLLEKFTQPNRNGRHSYISPQAHVHEHAHIGEGTQIGHFTVVEEGASVGKNCTIHPQVYIGRNVRIGDGCTLYAGVKIYFDCSIGQNCIVHANAVIGSDGFGYSPQEDKTWKKVPQVGNVLIEENVEIGANTCIDRASLGSTIVRSGVKIDNLVHIAHNVEIGRNTAIAAQVGIAGSAKIGENCMFGGQAGIAGHLSIADGVRLQAQSGVASNVKEPGKALFGAPAFDYKDYVRSYVVFKQLPELFKKINALEKELEQMKEGVI